MSYVSDLFEECEALRALVSAVDEEMWWKPTVFHGWTIYDEIAHNHFLDVLATKAIVARAEFASVAAEMQHLSQTDPDYSFRAFTNTKLGMLTRDEVMSRWVETYTRLCDLITASDPNEKMPWFGPPMTIMACASARQMETWAHGQDIYDLLKVRRQNADRIRNIALLGVKTFGWSFVNRGLAVPPAKPFVELTAPSGEGWQWNDPDSPESVTGSAEDFCLVVTQRRNVADTGLRVCGEGAAKWLEIAQCFAGGPADGPAPGERVVYFANGSVL